MSADQDDLTVLETAIGHRFHDRALLEQALTHPSCEGQPHYQRLEFIGDRVLGTVIADALYHTYPDAVEGDLALRFNALVRRETLAGLAQDIGLTGHIRLSPGEDQAGGRDKPAIQADVVEALIGALYQDGGFEAAKAFVRGHWDDLVTSVAHKAKDAKTQLQEWAQGRGLAKPSYQVVSREGPAHAPQFTITVVVGKQHQATGQGGTKRAAEQEAARALLDILGKAS